MIAGCPELEQLERMPLPPALRAHVSACSACKLVLDVFDIAGSASGEECLRYEPLLAARSDGTLNAAGANLLDRHLASCSTCRALESLSPTQDAVGDHEALPRVQEANYDIGLEIGRGGMGRVLAARDLRIGRPVAIKELRGNSRALAARFEREARVTARLQHPGIVPIYEIGQWPDGTPFYAMRMVDGRMLRVAIERCTSLPQRLAMLPNMIAACEAVAFAHGQRVIHRDLTPSNILVGAYGETVVIDWGLAKDLAASTADPDADDPYRTTPEGNALTGVGTVVGTAAYMPPEQARADVVDERADVYALGAILYHLLAGRSPYPATAGAVEAVKSGPPTPIEQVAPRAPRDLVSIVTKAMARDPRDRYPSARELADELRRFQTGRLVEAHVYTRAELVGRFVARHRAPVTVIVAAALVLAAVAWKSVSSIRAGRSDARATVRQLVIENGRTELLAGNPIRALAYLHQPYEHGERGAMLEFLLGNALSNLSSSATSLDCGGDARWVEYSPDGKSLAAACHDRGAILHLDSNEQRPLASASNGFDWLKYTADGTLLVTSGDDGVARLWDARTGAFIRSFKHGSSITFSTFTADGRRLLTTGDDGYARLWAVGTGALLLAVQANIRRERVWGKISGKGDLFFTMTLRGEGKGWDARTGEMRGTATHGGLVIGAELSADNTRALTCGYDTVVKLWDITKPTPGPLLALAGHTDVVWKCVFSPDGQLVVTAGQDGTAKVWELVTGHMIASVTHGAFVWSAAFAPDGRRFYTLGGNGRVNVWDARSGAQLAAWDSAHGKQAAFSPDSRQLAVVRGDGRVQVWDDPRIRLASYTPATNTLLAASADGTRVVEVSGTLAIIVRDTATGQRIGDASLREPVALSRRGHLAARTDDGVAIVDLATGAVVRRWPLDCKPSALDLAADRLALVCPDRARVIDTTTGRVVGALATAAAVRLADDGRRAVVAPSTGGAQVWEIERDVRRPLPVLGPAAPLGFARDGTRVAVKTAKAVMLIDADTGLLIRSELDSGVSPSFDPSGKWLTTIGATGVTVWSTLDGSTRSSFSTDHSTHQYSLTDVQASPDGKLVAAIGAAGALVFVMNAEDGRELARWSIAHDPPQVYQGGLIAPSATAAWTPDGHAIVTQSREVALWNARYVADQFQPSQIASIMRYVPWEVGANGELALIRDRKLVGRVVRDGQPVPDANIHLDVRIVPAGASALDYESMKTRFTDREVHSDDEGRFLFDGLIPGTYTLTVEGEPQRYQVIVDDDRPHDIELTR